MTGSQFQRIHLAFSFTIVLISIAQGKNVLDFKFVNWINDHQMCVLTPGTTVRLIFAKIHLFCDHLCQILMGAMLAFSYLLVNVNSDVISKGFQICGFSTFL